MAQNLIALLGTMAFLYFAKNMCIPIVLSIFLYFLLDPLVIKLEQRSFPRFLTSPLLVILVVGFLMFGGWVMFLTTSEISAHVPDYAEKLKTLTAYFMDKAEVLAEGSMHLFPKNNQVVQKVEVVRSMGDISSNILSWLDAIASVVGSIFMVPLLTLFFLIERNRLGEKLKAFSFLAQSGTELAEKTTRVVQGFFVGNLIAGIASTICFFTAFAVIDLDNKLALSIGAGFLNLIPIVGAFLAMIFPLAQGLLQFDTFAPFLMLILYSFVVHFLIGNFMLPKLMGSRVDLNVTAATLGMLFWGWLWGALGIFLAVPIMAVIKVICGLSTKTKSLEIILSESNKRSGSIILVESLRYFKNAGARR